MKKGTCKHFNGIQNDLCLAGLNMREVTGGDRAGWVKRAPCNIFHETYITCERFAEPTQAELDAEKAEWDKVLKRITTVMPVVNEWRNKEPIGKQEIIECPACQGKLHLSQSDYNGHIHGKCETEGCVSWME